MNIVLLIATFLGIFALITLYIKRRLIDRLHLSLKIRQLLWFFLQLNFLGIVGYLLARYFAATSNWLYFLLSLPIGILFLVFFTAILYDLFRTGTSYIPMRPQRRSFFQRSLDIGALGLAFGVSSKAVYEAKIVELETVEIVLKGLEQPYSIVQLSDTHIGGLIDKAFMEDVVDRVNILNPDIVVITGDLVDVPLQQAAKALEAFKKIKSRYGVYFIAGNHEYFHGIEEIMEAVEKLGIRMLKNENIFIGEKGKGFNLAGVYDLFGYRIGHHAPDINQALDGIDKNMPTVLLAHQPRFIEEADGKVDLMLSGHTHGGQLFPFMALVRLQQPYVKGLHCHSATTQVYVSKGTGFWGPPMRLGASSEMTYIKLKGTV